MWGRLTPENCESGAALLGLADMIRGYGPVRAEAVLRYGEELARLVMEVAADGILRQAA